MASRRQQRSAAGSGRSGLNQSLTTGTDDEAGENTPMVNGPRQRRDTEDDAQGGNVEMRSGPAGGGKEAEPEDDVTTNQQTVTDEGDGKAQDDAAEAPGGGRRNRGGKKGGEGGGAGSSGDADIENNKRDDWTMAGPFKVLEPIRTDPVKLLQTRKNRLERFAVQGMPEIHFVGQITSGTGLINDANEGVCLRWKVDCGEAWEHLGGETLGQTQISYCRVNDQEAIPFNHPIDLHYAAAGLQGWGGAPRIAFQCYKLDWHGRRLLVGYAFEHLPTTPGPHRMEVNLWRPVGSPEQELDAFLLGRVPALTSHEPLYESAWRERCRLVTETAGKVSIDVYVVARNMQAKVDL